ncbi:ribbon-helix-helix domain-containing protein [Mesorhizobium sp. J428]|uniref:ribbon-helix-helix domain-containing protein n=1 Tax=Mesorhizobium sp. J428 TaxID=2898440 RepID=UPI002150D3F9|nr:ribbon-helix-helix domain-containing protein [Mesorhizobium sp. J428]MCR5859435.1 ribbon-helix-helix domain-containing protein [Mesorhizobium sp. J428]
MSAVRKRSVSIRGHRTSFSVEQEFFDALEEIASARGISFAALVAEVDAARQRDTNLSSALRVHALKQAKAGSTGRDSDAD